MAGPSGRSSMDDVIDAYRPGIDCTLLRENLRRTVAERLDRLQEHYEFATAMRKAGREAFRTGAAAGRRA